MKKRFSYTQTYLKVRLIAIRVSGT